MTHAGFQIFMFNQVCKYIELNNSLLGGFITCYVLLVCGVAIRTLQAHLCLTPSSMCRVNTKVLYKEKKLEVEIIF